LYRHDEDAAKARLNGFLSALEGMKAAKEIAAAFDECRGALTSPALLALVTEAGAVS
jgi:DNA mismatch repair protein MSH6